MERLKIDYILDNDEEILKEMKQAYLDCAPAVTINFNDPNNMNGQSGYPYGGDENIPDGKDQ